MNSKASTTWWPWWDLECLFSTSSSAPPHSPGRPAPLSVIPCTGPPCQTASLQTQQSSLSLCWQDKQGAKLTDNGRFTASALDHAGVAFHTSTSISYCSDRSRSIHMCKCSFGRRSLQNWRQRKLKFSLTQMGMVQDWRHHTPNTLDRLRPELHVYS